MAFQPRHEKTCLYVLKVKRPAAWAGLCHSVGTWKMEKLTLP